MVFRILHPNLHRPVQYVNNIVEQDHRGGSAMRARGLASQRVEVTASQESFLLHPGNRRAVAQPRVINTDQARLGCDGSVSALRNRRLAVAVSHKPESTKSIVAPVESMAR